LIEGAIRISRQKTCFNGNTILVAEILKYWSDRNLYLQKIAKPSDAEKKELELIQNERRDREEKAKNYCNFIRSIVQ
jgi:hypothetical protein